MSSREAYLQSTERAAQLQAEGYAVKGPVTPRNLADFIDRTIARYESHEMQVRGRVQKRIREESAA